MKKILIICLSIIFSVFIKTNLSYAQPMHPRLEKCQPTYGKYCYDSKRGWYGAKKTVKTDSDAREILLQSFAPYKDIKIGTIKEKDSFFEAEITDENGIVVDLVIIDKRTGRIRSVY
ncbi:MAG: hypothetical protein HZA09_05955 [Nitrospirae bacterium]|nr:hypothetical protein [Nitrospirota bacterium]